MKKTETKAASAESNLDKIVNRVSQFTKVQRILICVALFLVIFGIFGYFDYKPKYDEFTRLNQELVELRQKYDEYEKVAKDIDKVRKQKEEAEVKYRKGLRLLPDQEEIPELLDGIAKAGKEVNVAIISFRPGDKATGTDLYAIKPLDLAIAGSFHNVALFFDRIAKLFRIVNILEFQLTPSKSPNQAADSDIISATMKANAYVFVESKPGEGKEGGKDAKKDKGKEAATKADEKEKPK